MTNRLILPMTMTYILLSIFVLFNLALTCSNQLWLTKKRKTFFFLFVLRLDPHTNRNKFVDRLVPHFFRYVYERKRIREYGLSSFLVTMSCSDGVFSDWMSSRLRKSIRVNVFRFDLFGGVLSLFSFRLEGIFETSKWASVNITIKWISPVMVKTIGCSSLSKKTEFLCI